MFRFPELKNNPDIVRAAIFIAALAGLAVLLFFLVFGAESYSSLYIAPGSIIHSTDNTVFYQYGVKSSELRKTEYTLGTYVNTTLIKTKKFSLDKGEILEERDKIILPADVHYPVKISLRLTTDKSADEVHFWLS